MEILVLLLIGLLAGWLASVIVRGGGMGIVGNMLLGIVGAFIGGFIFDILDIPVNDLGRFASAVLGAILLLLIIRAFERPRTEP